MKSGLLFNLLCLHSSPEFCFSGKPQCGNAIAAIPASTASPAISSDERRGDIFCPIKLDPPPQTDISILFES